ncbi:FtsQ-type POTRA domain-containing protein [Rhodococcus antarcticus]|uniref:FtsQ-type POTRA domain-containing protein n=1 Tax=Rhodococcus antarcticus TaxID=2987751 RepID=A0ABY6NWB4_9NOCA|nr:FtsQ-type POTRA domain-containing protein [Rhodococcus antarcticus]UZJ23524.1 FtsQ-type POTRA domain-containing protein [Rhodococcus antarcticus]
MSPSGRAPGSTGRESTRTTARPRRSPARPSGPQGPTPRAQDRPNRRPAPPVRRVLGLRVRTLVVLVALLVVVLGAVAWFSPLLSVRSVTVQGETVVTEQQVLDALDVPAGTRLVGLDLAAAAARVAALPRVASATVDRTLPSRVAVTVVERTAVAWVAAADGQHLLDASGVDYAVEAPAPGVPRLAVATPGPGDPSTRAALGVLTSLPDPVRALVATVGATSASAVQLTLTDGRTVVWGGVDGAARKAEVLTAVLTQPGSTYDVSSPDLPTVR